MHRIAEGIEDRRVTVVNGVRKWEHINRRQRDVFGKAAWPVHPNPHRVSAQMTGSGAAVTAVAAGDVAFPTHPLAHAQALHMASNFGNTPDKLMTGDHWHRNSLLRPFIPVINVHVGAANRALGHLNQYVIGPDLGHRSIHHPDAGLGLTLG